MKLEQWMRLEGLDALEMAGRLGVARPTIYRYLQETRIPDVAIMERIVTVTRGAVCPQDFYGEVMAAATAAIARAAKKSTARRGRTRAA